MLHFVNPKDKPQKIQKALAIEIKLEEFHKKAQPLNHNLSNQTKQGTGLERKTVSRQNLTINSKNVREDYP